MIASRQTATALERLLREVSVELEAMRSHRDKLRQAAARLSSDQNTEELRAYVAVGLHAYYTAAEELFARVARTVDGSEPSGPQTHKDLLRQMALDWPPARPAILDGSVHSRLTKLLGFRHFFRHAYVVELDDAELLDHCANLAALHPALFTSLDTFFEHIRATIRALQGEPPP